MKMPKTIPSLIDAIGGQTAFADAVGMKRSAVSMAKLRGRLDIRWWPKAMRAAKRVGIDIDAADLLKMHGVR